MPFKARTHTLSQHSRIPKRKGRKRKHHRAGSGVGRPRKVVQKDEDEYASITAETATNLKAFRQLFASYDDDVEEEFLGYYTKEILTIQKTCKKKIRRYKRDEMSLHREEELLLNSLNSSVAAAQLLSKTSDSSCSSSFSSNDKKDLAMTNSFHKLHGDISISAQEDSETKFLGFSETDLLPNSCHAKAIKLSEYCKKLQLNEDVEPKPSTSISQAKVGISDVHRKVNGKVTTDLHEPKKKRGRKKKSANIPVIQKPSNPIDTTSNLTSNAIEKEHWTENGLKTLKQFVQTESIAGEITVTPILQSDLPLGGVKLAFKSPITINCLPNV